MPTGVKLEVFKALRHNHLISVPSSVTVLYFQFCSLRKVIEKVVMSQVQL